MIVLYSISLNPHNVVSTQSPVLLPSILNFVHTYKTAEIYTRLYLLAELTVKSPDLGGTQTRTRA